MNASSSFIATSMAVCEYVAAIVFALATCLIIMARVLKHSEPEDSGAGPDSSDLH